jgi:hypothetical protein
MTVNISITNLTATMAKCYLCPAYSKGCKRCEQHRYDALFDACSDIPPCIPDNARIPVMSAIDTLGTHRASRITEVSKYRARLCEAKRRCGKCGAMKGSNHECNKRFSSNCLKNREFGCKCYVSLSDSSS